MYKSMIMPTLRILSCFTMMVCLPAIASSLLAQGSVARTDIMVDGKVNSTADLLSAGIASLRVPDQFMDLDSQRNPIIEKAVPLELYSQEQLDYQRNVNSQAEAIVTIEIDEEKEFLTAFDREAITPLTWKWVDLQVTKEDGSLSLISLRRPNWWIKSMGIHEVGDLVLLNLPEIGIAGSAYVKNIRANALDTRIWSDQHLSDNPERPITGRFLHEVDQIYLLYFDSLPEPVGVTAGHPIWSADQGGWVATKDLQIGESIRTPEGTQRLVRVEVKDGNFEVYNIEVYRNHNYLVSSSKLLVHNVCWFDKKWKDIKFEAEQRSKLFGNIRMFYASKREGNLLRVYVDMADSDGAKTDFGMVSFLKQIEKEAREQGIKKLEIGAYPVINKELKKGFKELGEGEGIKGFKVSYTTDEWGDGAVLITKDLD